MLGMSKKAAPKDPLVLVTVADACVRLQVSRRTLYRMILQGVLPEPKRLGQFRQAYFEKEAFEAACREALG